MCDISPKDLIKNVDINLSKLFLNAQRHILTIPTSASFSYRRMRRRSPTDSPLVIQLRNRPRHLSEKAARLIGQVVSLLSMSALTSGC